MVIFGSGRLKGEQTAVPCTVIISTPSRSHLTHSFFNRPFHLLRSLVERARARLVYTKLESGAYL